MDGEEIGGEVWENERYERIFNDYEQDIVGTWEGMVTSDEDDHTDGELHRWEYKADGTYVYYRKWLTAIGREILTSFLTILLMALCCAPAGRRLPTAKKSVSGGRLRASRMAR